MTYAVAFTPRAERDLRKTPAQERERIRPKVLALAENPRPPGVKPLKGYAKGVLRLRVGDYRVIYAIDDAKREVTICGVGHRSEVYD